MLKSKTNNLVNFLALFCSSGILLLMLFPLTTTAAFTKQINYQGKLTDSAGTAVTDGSKLMTFRLYASSTGGAALWSETDSVLTTGGLFSLMLGASSTLGVINFNQPLYLSLEVESDGEMFPRKVLGAVTNSFNSEKFGGLATSSFLRSDISNATGTINNLNSQYLTVNGNISAPSITLGGVTRTTWPGGGSGTDVNWSHNPLTDTLTPATSTSGIIVNGTSTLATTTMALGSSFGLPSGANMTVSDFTINDLGSGPLISFNAPGIIIPGLQKLGGISEGLGLYEGSGNPALFFVDKTLDLAQIVGNDAHLASIIYSTTSRELAFGGAVGGYLFDQNINLANGKCLAVNGVCTGATSWADDGTSVSLSNPDRNFILGASNSVSASSTAVFLIGGIGNFASSTSNYGGIIGGYRNRLDDGGLIITTGGDNYSDTGGMIFGAGRSTSTAGAIFGGYSNQTFNNFNAVVVGGAGNIASSTNGGVFAGEGNIASGWRSVIVGGQSNTAWGLASGVYNGTGNVSSGVSSSVLGGDNNNIGTTSWGSVILGGRDSSVTGFYSSVLVGNNNLIIGDNSISLDGAYNTITGDSSDIIGGRRNWVSGDGSYAFGYNMTVSANHSMGFGLQSINDNSTSSNYVITQDNIMSIMGGNVGIGLTNPSTALSVLGIASSTGLRVNGGATTTNLAITSLTNSYLSVNSLGQVISTTTPLIVLTGDVTTSGSAATIANSAVTLAKMANLAYGTIIGRSTNSTGVPQAISTSTYKTMLALNTNDLTEGSKLFWTNLLFDTRLSATTSLPNLSTLSGLTIIGSSTGQTTILGKTILTNASTTNLTVATALNLTGLSSAFLTVNGSGQVVATNSPRELFSTTATGLTYTSGTGILSLSSGYEVPLTASTSNWNLAYGWGNHALAGYLTNSLFDTRLAATTSLPNLSTLAGLTIIGSSTGQTTILGKTILTNASTTNLTVAQNLNVLGTSTLGSVLPLSNLTYSIGSADYRYNDIWTKTLNLGTSTWSLSPTSNGSLAISDAPQGAGSVRLYIASSTGNVGIGTVNPSTKLEVLGIASTTGLMVNGDGYLSGVLGIGTNPYGNGVKFAVNGGNLTNPDNGFSYNASFVAGTDNLDGENVFGGMGVVYSNDNGSSNLTTSGLLGLGNGTGTMGVLGMGGGGGAGGMFMSPDGGIGLAAVGGSPNLLYDNVISPASSALHFTDGVGLVVANASSSLYSIASLQGLNYFAGNVGIGTTSPTALLSVSGDTFLSGNFTNLATSTNPLAFCDDTNFDNQVDCENASSIWYGAGSLTGGTNIKSNQFINTVFGPFYTALLSEPIISGELGGAVGFTASTTNGIGFMGIDGGFGAGVLGSSLYGNGGVFVSMGTGTDNAALSVVNYAGSPYGYGAVISGVNALYASSTYGNGYAIQALGSTSLSGNFTNLATGTNPTAFCDDPSFANQIDCEGGFANWYGVGSTTGVTNIRSNQFISTIFGNIYASLLSSPSVTGNQAAGAFVASTTNGVGFAAVDNGDGMGVGSFSLRGSAGGFFGGGTTTDMATLRVENFAEDPLGYGLFVSGPNALYASSTGRYAIQALGNTLLDGNATTTGNQRIQGNLIVDGHIIFAGDERDSWPGGSSVGNGWATTSSNVMHPDLLSPYAIVIGGGATTTDSAFEVYGNTYLSGGLTISNKFYLSSTTGYIGAGINNSNPSAWLDLDFPDLSPVASLGGQATGKRSVSMIGSFFGISSQAQGDYSLAAGAQTLAQGDYSVALGGYSGQGTRALGLGSIAMGNGALSDGEDSIALGYTANASGTGAVALGNSTAIGHLAFSAGGLAHSNGELAVALTGGNVNGLGSFGLFSTVTGQHSIGLGFDTASSTINASNSVLIGNGSITQAGVISLMPASGYLGIGTTSPTFALVVGSGAEGATSSIQVPRGGICVDDDGWCVPPVAGEITAYNYNTDHSDLAENYPAFEASLSAGYIVSASNLNNSGFDHKLGFGVKKSTPGEAYLGVVSTNPGVTLGLSRDTGKGGQVPVALSGRVPVKVNLEGGPIVAGDYVTLSSLPGVGTKATSSGQTIGIALESFSNTSDKDANGVGEVMVFVNLGFAHLSPQISQGALSSNDLWHLDEVTGQIKAGYSIDLNNFDLLNVRTITSASGAWKIDEAGSLVVKSVKAERGEFDEMIVNNGVTVKDSDTGEYQCLYVASGSVKTKPGPCSEPSLSPAENNLPSGGSGVVDNPTSAEPVTTSSSTDSETPPVVENSPTKEPDPVKPISPPAVSEPSSPDVMPPAESPAP